MLYEYIIDDPSSACNRSNPLFGGWTPIVPYLIEPYAVRVRYSSYTYWYRTDQRRFFGMVLMGRIGIHPHASVAEDDDRWSLDSSAFDRFSDMSELVYNTEINKNIRTAPFCVPFFRIT